MSMWFIWLSIGRKHLSPPKLSAGSIPQDPGRRAAAQRLGLGSGGLELGLWTDANRSKNGTPITGKFKTTVEVLRERSEKCFKTSENPADFEQKYE